MKERAIDFGSHGGLVGIVTEPSEPGEAPRGGRRAFIMSNVGMHHRVGPYRLYVELARFLASRGWYVLRFDMSGLGDSEARRGGHSDSERASCDMTEAIDWMVERLGVTRVVLLGLCSGVDSTHAVTVADDRVTGSIFIDGYTYPTTGFLLRRFVVRYLQTRRWVPYARRKLSAVKSRNGRAVASEETVVFTRDYPPLTQFREQVRAVAVRGTRMLFIFTGSVDYRYNGRAQLFEHLGERPPREQIAVEYLKEVDHLFSTESSRVRLFTAIDSWLNSNER